MPSYFESLATQALQQVGVYIGTPSGFAPSVWNETEWATVPVVVTNSTGLVLRNAVVELVASGVPAVVLAYGGMPPIIKWVVGEVKPGQTMRHDFRVCPRNDGTLTLSAILTAEVVPCVTRGSVWRAQTIYPL